MECKKTYKLLLDEYVMGQNDLGTCVILSPDDTKRLGINIKNLEYVGLTHIAPIKGLSDSNIKRRLRSKVEKIAESYNAEVAIINEQTDSLRFFTIGYGFAFFYRYKN